MVQVIDVACPKCHRAFKIELGEGEHPGMSLRASCDHCGATKSLLAFQKERKRIVDFPAIEKQKHRREDERRARSKQKADNKATGEQQAKEYRARAAEREARYRATEKVNQEKNLTLGRGCPQCGSMDIVQSSHTTGAGWAIAVIGLLLACFTMGVSLVLCVGALFLTQRRGKCRDCKWLWTP